MKKVLGILLTTLITITTIGCTPKTKDSSNVEDQDNSKVNVVVSFHAMKELTELIGKDKINITSVIPEGTDAHDFEPKASDIKNLAKADVFVYNGLDMEEWADSLIESANNDSLQVVKVSEGVETIKLDEEEHQHIDSEETEEHNHEDEDSDAEHNHDHGSEDPHIWLSAKESQVVLKNIKDGLIKTDEDNKASYEENYDAAIKELESIYNEYKEKFEQVENKHLVTAHEAFGYVARDFGIEQVGVEDAFATGDPTAVRMKNLIEYCKENDIKTVFSEKNASSKISDTLANEAGAKVETLQTFESEGDYIAGLKDNLEKIYNGMK